MELIFTCEIVTFPVLCSFDDLPGAGAGASVGVGVGVDGLNAVKSAGVKMSRCGVPIPNRRV